jgi:catechol 2,3-dioxygenase-like lactoylglutathione lyase family enzyme
MKKNIFFIIGLSISFFLGLSLNNISKSKKEIINNDANKKLSQENLKLGAFSVSLSVKDLKVSRQFYENLGFTVKGGDMEKNYIVMKNENSIIGLFQGMFQGNILTFNPGWDENGKNIESFEDVREIQKKLKNKNIILTNEADEKTSGPAFVILSDPDGNVIYIDQHR